MSLNMRTRFGVRKNREVKVLVIEKMNQKEGMEEYEKVTQKF